MDGTGEPLTFRIACELWNGFGLSEDETFALMMGEWNQRSDPPWEATALRKKISNAVNFSKGQRGSKLAEGTRTTSTGVPLQLVGADGNPVEEAADPRPVIRVDMADMDRMVRESEAALMANCPDLYQSLMRIVIVHTVGEARKPSSQFKIPDEPIIDQVSEHWLSVLLERSARWTKRQMDKTSGLWIDAPAPVPDKVAKTLLVKPSKGFRYLKGIIEAPTLRPDGTLLSAPGFDERTGLLYLPSGQFPEIPDTPTAAERQAAIDLLLEIVQDFPFAAECHRSAAVAAIITPLLRPTYEGNTPLMVGDAPTPGSGKGHWARLASRLACGRRSAGNTLSDDDKENKLNLFSYALSGRRMVVFEEVQELKSKALNMVVTDGIEGRIYHSQKMAKADAEFTIYCNGNNLVIHDDTRRRMNYIRLEPAEENPEERANFLHPELENWVVENRGRIVAAVLTLARAYHLAGCPMRLPAFNSFNGWSKVVRGMLVWAGMADPRAGSADVNTNADERIASFRGFLELVQARYGQTGMTLARIVSENDGNDLGSVLLELAPSRSGTEVDQNKLKYIVRKFARRTMGGRRIVAESKGRGIRKWIVETVSEGREVVAPPAKLAPSPPEMVAPGPETAALPLPPAATIDDRSVLEGELEGALVQWLGQAGAVSVELWRVLASKPGAQAWATSPLPGVAPYVPMARRFAQLDDGPQRVLVSRAAAYVEAQMLDMQYDIGRPKWRWAVHRTETLDAWLTWLREHGGGLT
jgi:putative DNA primase/helicase